MRREGEMYNMLTGFELWLGAWKRHHVIDCPRCDKGVHPNSGEGMFIAEHDMCLSCDHLLADDPRYDNEV